MRAVKTLKSLAATLVLLAPAFASAGPMLGDVTLGQSILGGKLFVAESGNVQATFQGTDASYFNSLYLAGSDTRIFNSNSSVGATMDLGYFEAGTELVFMLAVNDTGHQFFSGDGSANADGVAHAQAITTFNQSLDQYVTTLGFEDLFGGGDRDYNDFNLMLSNVVDPLDADEEAGIDVAQVPEPGTLALLGALMVAGPAARRLLRSR